MHISDGILNAQTCIGAAAAAACLVAYTLKKTDSKDIPRISVMTAAFFVASLVHIKLGPASTHLTLNGLVGIILGFGAFPAILVALLFQAIIFQHGGITTLGVNSLVMGLPALCAYGIFLLHRMFPKNKRIFLPVFSFIAGAAAIILSGLLGASLLVLTGKEFHETAKVMLIAHGPLALVEGTITVLAVSFLSKVKPEIIYK